MPRIESTEQLGLELPFASRPLLPLLISVPAANVEAGVFVEAFGHSVGVLTFDSSEDLVKVIDFLLEALCIGRVRHVVDLFLDPLFGLVGLASA